MKKHLLLIALLSLSSCRTTARLDFDLAPIASPGSPAWSTRGAEQEKEYSLKACVVDRLAAQPILDETFRIDGAEGTSRLETDPQGCLHWKEKITYRSDEKKEYRKLDRTFVGIGTMIGTLSLQIAINPWTDSIIDTRFQEVPTVATVAARVSAHSIEYRFLGRSFEMDRHLRLSQTREYRVTLSPQWSRTDGEPSSTIPEGEKFRMSVLFAGAGKGTHAPLESKRFLSRYDAVVEVNAHNQIVANVPLRVDFPEEPQLDAGLEVFVELSTVEPTDAKSFATSQQFEARKPRGGGSLAPEPFDVDGLQSRLVPREMPMDRIAFGNLGTVVKPALPWEKSPYDLLLSSLKGAAPGLEVHEVSELPLPPKPDPFADLPKLEGNQPRTSFTSKGKVTIDCHRPTSADFPLLKGGLPSVIVRKPAPPRWPGFVEREIEVMDSLVSANLPPPRIADDSWQFTASIFHESSDFERTLQSKQSVSSWEGGVMGYTNHAVEAEAGVKFLGNGATYKGAVGVDARFGWWHRDQTASIRETNGFLVDNRNRVTLAEHRVLYVEERAFNFQANTRRCLLLTPVEGNKAPARLYCVREKKLVKENWYYIADFDFRHDVPVERRDLRERVLVKLLRGRDAYRRLKGLLSDGINEFRVSEVSAMDYGINPLLEEALQRKESVQSFFADGGIFPGVIERSAEVSTPGQLPGSESIGR